MKIIKQSHQILDPIDGQAILKRIEYAGRTCYQSRELAAEGTAERFVKSIIASGHHSVLEHINLSVSFITDRGMTHQIVRHRLMAYSQESTKCNYGKFRFGHELTFILPIEFYNAHDRTPGETEDQFNQRCSSTLRNQYISWHSSLVEIEKNYFKMLEDGASPLLARSLLPNCLKAELIVTGNIRSWRHFLFMRTAKDAHPQIQALTKPLHEEFKGKIPMVFDELSA